MSFGLQILTRESGRPMRSVIGEPRYHLQMMSGLSSLSAFERSLLCEKVDTLAGTCRSIVQEHDFHLTCYNHQRGTIVHYGLPASPVLPPSAPKIALQMTDCLSPSPEEAHRARRRFLYRAEPALMMFTIYVPGAAILGSFPGTPQKQCPC